MHTPALSAPVSPLPVQRCKCPASHSQARIASPKARSLAAAQRFENAENARQTHCQVCCALKALPLIVMPPSTRHPRDPAAT